MLINLINKKIVACCAIFALTSYILLKFACKEIGNMLNAIFYMKYSKVLRKKYPSKTWDSIILPIRRQTIAKVTEFYKELWEEKFYKTWNKTEQDNYNKFIKDKHIKVRPDGYHTNYTINSNLLKYKFIYSWISKLLAYLESHPFYKKYWTLVDIETGELPRPNNTYKFWVTKSEFELMQKAGYQNFIVKDDGVYSGPSPSDLFGEENLEMALDEYYTRKSNNKYSHTLMTENKQMTMNSL